MPILPLVLAERPTSTVVREAFDLSQPINTIGKWTTGLVVAVVTCRAFVRDSECDVSLGREIFESPTEPRLVKDATNYEKTRTQKD